jgi:xylan 1,4-beta-xylosidase
MRYDNPILQGCYPDPSICRVGEDYYLVTSTFCYFPGVPIFHSRDLVHWRQLGHVLTKPEQLPLNDADNIRGIYAPTLRYHDGLFYVVTTNMDMHKHFYVSTSDPAGVWSDPVWLDGGGIDPSLFFDEDGRVYFTWTDLTSIYQCEIDLDTGRHLTAPSVIWTGSGGSYPEGPHLYKINGLYYLMIAEGGTEYGHMETIARSASPNGPFESCPRNPILTHRHRSRNLIQGTGHADLIQAHDGSWWVVFLAFQQMMQYRYYHHLGRETFLAPVTWDEAGWPVINGSGTVDLIMDPPTLPAHPWPTDSTRDEFDTPGLGMSWNFLGSPPTNACSLTERPGWLRLKGSALTLTNPGFPVFVGRRQQHFNCTISTLLDFSPSQDGQEAGLSVYMNHQHHYEIAVVRENGTHMVIVRRRIGTLSAVVARQNIPVSPVCLKIQADRTHYTFSFVSGTLDEVTLAEGETHYLSSEVAGGFTGIYLGMYVTGNGNAALEPADFDWFDYQPSTDLSVIS